MTTIAVVQCGARKRAQAAPARDLYTGPLFLALRAAAERVADRWYIASAKHGLVEPSRVLRPYDVTLDGVDEAWGQRVLDRLREFEPAGWDRIIALCSRRYLARWAGETRAETPIAGLSIGRAISAARRVR